MRILNCKRNIKKLVLFHHDETIDLWALDEVRFEQHGTRCRMWIPPEVKEPFVLHHPTRKSVGYFGAVRLRDGKFVYRREEDKFNGMTFFSFLKQLRRISTCSGRKVVVIIDNVRYHHARLHAEWRKKSTEKFSLEFMPPYSPELNPIERVWKLTRRKGIHNR
ncbi:MAG: IS630 family transposase [Desulfovibrio sp.]|nr:IS630 family transposase [Desulfovibrio sp.]